MRKALRITWLLAVAIALSAWGSAQAEAPIVGNLPAVIIGDAGNIAGTGTAAMHLLKYDNVFNLADDGIILRKNNPTTTSKLSVYYTAHNAVNPASNTLVASNATHTVAPMTDLEAAALMAGTPPAGKQINTATSRWLSLIHDNGSLTGPSATATAAANGSTASQIAAKGMLDPVVVTLFAIDEFPEKVGSGSFVVYTQLGVGDSYSDIIIEPPHGPDGWVYSTKDASRVGPNANLAACPSLTTPDAIGFKGLSSFPSGKTQAFSSWEFLNQGVPLLTAAGMGNNKIFKMTASMSGDATDSANTPAYRLLFLSWNFAHVGGFQASSDSSLATLTNRNVPDTTHMIEARLYWAVPVNTYEYADGQTAGAGRDYYLSFDCMQNSVSDTGSIMMIYVTIEKILRPANATPQAAYGAIGRDGVETLAFDAAGKGWASSPLDPSGTGERGWGLGSVTVTPSAVDVSMVAGTAIKSVFQQVQPVADPTVFPAWVSNRLIRVTWNLRSSDVAATPDFRVIVLPWMNSLSGIGHTAWGEAFSPSAFRFVYAPPDNPGLAIAPKTTGSMIETYVYTMNAPTATSEASMLTPVFDIDQPKGTTLNPINFPQNGWMKPDGTLTIQGFMMEVCGPN